MNLLLHPTYFPNIATFSAIVQNDVCWEVHDNYQKQTFRNRCPICTDLGQHALTIPIRHVGGEHGRQKFKEVRVDNTYAWQRQHWRTLQTAYRTSPFFEYYEDDLAPLFEREREYLLDFNLETIAVLCGLLQVPLPTKKTSIYTIAPETHPDSYRDTKPETIDARFLINAKKERDFEQEPYAQVFGDRHGFIKNTSVLDLLFNEGKNTLAYLQNQNLDFLNA